MNAEQILDHMTNELHTKYHHSGCQCEHQDEFEALATNAWVIAFPIIKNLTLQAQARSLRTVATGDINAWLELLDLKAEDLQGILLTLALHFEAQVSSQEP